MKALTKLLVATMIIVLLVQPLDAQEKGKKFNVNDPVGRNAVTFKSMAPLEDIVGTTSDIKGYLFFDPANPQEGGSGRLVVSISSLNTGIPLRDEHLRSEQWMNAGKYPQIKLDINKIDEVREVKITDQASTYDIIAMGDITIKGITKSVEIPGRITYLRESETTRQRLPGDILAVRADFSVDLADFGITGPDEMEIIGSKVGESIDIEVSIMGSTGSDAVPEI